MKLNWKKLSFQGALSIAGFGFISAALWFIAMPLGLGAIGASLLLLDWMREDNKSP